MHQQAFLLAIVLNLLSPLVEAFSFQLTNTPTQCQNLIFQITGSGSPPYSLLLIPYGSSPLPNNVEVRTIQSVQFAPAATSLSLQLVYPSASQFVAVISDQTGFGTGGTSVSTTVQSSSDASCFNVSNPAQPAFFYSINPSNQLVQCQSSRLWWDNSSAIQGIPSFQGVIPGGQSFQIPQGTITNVPQQGTGYSWTPTTPAGTTLMLVGGDNRQMGNAGSSTYIVSYNYSNNNNSCPTANSPSSTPGTPAGAVYPTSSSTSTSSSSVHSTRTSVGAIVGGVIGGVAAFVIAILATVVFMRRRRSQKSNKERPSILIDNDDDDPTVVHRDRLPQYYTPEPFTLPERSTHSRTPSGTNPQESLLTYVTNARPETQNGGTTFSGKSSAPSSFRPANFILHEDAGPSEISDGHEEPETVELPPAYANIRS